MNAVASREEQTLLAQLARARERLDGLVRNLRSIDGELEELATERKQYRLLHEVCAGLEELDGMDASHLFWGDPAEGARGMELLRAVRGRVDLFEKRLSEIEERRQAAFEEVQRQEEATEWLEEELFEAQQREEERKLEWIVERNVEFAERALVMPWTSLEEEKERLRKSLAAAMLLSLLLGLVIPLIPLPIPERGEPIDVPERLTRLIREERPLLPPPPPVQETKPEETKPENATEVAQQPAKTQTKTKKAASKGILAFREKFSGLAASTASARLGSAARISNPGEAVSGLPERSMVTSQTPGSSGGINLASLSRDTGSGGDGIEGVQVARATSSIGGVAGEDRPLAGGPSMGRTDEEIQIVFDRHKAALYRLYNRELRRDPTLRGQMVLRLRIEPDGSVSLCAVQSTDMNAPDLAAQVVARVGTFDFGAKEGISPVTILYPIDFLPAT